MVEEVDELISKKTGTELNLSSNYIRSFSHQIHLIMTIGLEAIQVDPAGLVKDKRSMLGCVPILAPIGDGSGEADALDEDDLFGFEDELDSFDDDEMYDYDSSDGEIKRKGKIHDILEKTFTVLFSELYSSQEKMEGEKSSACLMISEYRYLLAFIKKQKTLNKEPEFERMYEE
ncbi:hypothetical protein H4Q26_001275 [Puccinia striiformis f. sp. tritici PST-130]|nr:hypothetical protein H4Q26_001275 [Puccinia striiformis f. sp. tritici PST-130]